MCVGTVCTYMQECALTSVTCLTDLFDELPHIPHALCHAHDEQINIKGGPCHVDQARADGTVHLAELIAKQRGKHLVLDGTQFAVGLNEVLQSVVGRLHVSDVDGLCLLRDAQPKGLHALDLSLHLKEQWVQVHHQLPIVPHQDSGVEAPMGDFNHLHPPTVVHQLVFHQDLGHCIEPFGHLLAGGRGNDVGFVAQGTNGVLHVNHQLSFPHDGPSNGGHVAVKGRVLVISLVSLQDWQVNISNGNKQTTIDKLFTSLKTRNTYVCM